MGVANREGGAVANYVAVTDAVRLAGKKTGLLREVIKMRMAGASHNQSAKSVSAGSTSHKPPKVNTAKR